MKYRVMSLSYCKEFIQTGQQAGNIEMLEPFQAGKLSWVKEIEKFHSTVHIIDMI